MADAGPAAAAAPADEFAGSAGWAFDIFVLEGDGAKRRGAHVAETFSRLGAVTLPPRTGPHALRLTRDPEHATSALERFVEHCFERTGVLDDCAVERRSFRAFVAAARAAHRNCAFHNWWHVCDVTHAVSVLLVEGAAAAQLPPPDRLALLLSALCHDADHPGLTNGFMARSAHPLVAQLGTPSTLERHHAAVAASLLSLPRCAGVLGGLDEASRARVQSLIPALIAATDIEQHGAHMAAFQAAWGADVAGDDVAKRDALAALLLKAADVSNAAKPWRLARRWAGLLKAEHLLLAELEADAGLSPTPFLSLPIPQLCKGFIDGIAAPMLERLAAVMPFAADVALPLARANAAAWARLAAGESAAEAGDAEGDADVVVAPEWPRIGSTPLACVAGHRAAAPHAGSPATPVPLSPQAVAVL